MIKGDKPQPHHYYHDQEEPRRAIFEPTLSNQRYTFIEQFLLARPNIKSVADLGCGSGRMLNWLKSVPHIGNIKFVDVDISDDEYDLSNRYCGGLTELVMGRTNSSNPLDIEVIQADIRQPEEMLRADCMILVEVIEHLQRTEIDGVANLLFDFYNPNYVIMTTPNSDFNVLLWAELDCEPKFRHWDHKFEFTRRQFRDWANSIVERYPDYDVSFDGVGHLQNSQPLGPCTQIAIFTKLTAEQETSQSNNIIITNKAKLITKFHIRGGNEPSKDIQSIDWHMEYMQQCGERTVEEDFSDVSNNDIMNDQTN